MNEWWTINIYSDRFEGWRRSMPRMAKINSKSSVQSFQRTFAFSWPTTKKERQHSRWIGLSSIHPIRFSLPSKSSSHCCQPLLARCTHLSYYSPVFVFVDKRRQVSWWLVASVEVAIILWQNVDVVKNEAIEFWMSGRCLVEASVHQRSLVEDLRFHLLQSQSIDWCLGH